MLNKAESEGENKEASPLALFPDLPLFHSSVCIDYN